MVSQPTFVALTFVLAYSIMGAVMVLMYVIWLSPDEASSPTANLLATGAAAHFGYFNTPGFATVTSEWSVATMHMYVTLLVWITVLVVGFTSEAVVGLPLVKFLATRGIVPGSSSSPRPSNEGTEDALLVTLWHGAQLYFSLFVLVAFMSESVFGLPLLVMGLWKFGFPETLTYMIEGRSRGLLSMEGMASYIGTLGIILHHSSSSLAIVGLATHLWPHHRGLTALCLPTIVQHWFALLRYHSRRLYLALCLSAELVFEWEVLGNLHALESIHREHIRFGRGVACTLLLAHWLYLFSGGLEMLAGWRGGGDAVYAAEQESQSKHRRTSIATLAHSSASLRDDSLAKRAKDSPASFRFAAETLARKKRINVFGVASSQPTPRQSEETPHTTVLGSLTAEQDGPHKLSPNSDAATQPSTSDSSSKSAASSTQEASTEAFAMGIGWLVPSAAPARTTPLQESLAA